MKLRDSAILAQHRVKRALKPLLFKNDSRLRTVRHGPAQGVRLLLNRRTDLQREFGLWEHELNSIYRAHIQAHSVVYDVGAADGMTALMFASLASRGQVFAFEPEAERSAALERNLAANPQLAGRITPIRALVGSGATRLDEFAQRERAPDFVKIDVDGAELDVLHTMSRLVRDGRTVIVVETHSAELEVACSQFLRQHNHDVRLIKNAWWRVVFPEFRPIEQNRWLFSYAQTPNREHDAH